MNLMEEFSKFNNKIPFSPTQHRDENRDQNEIILVTVAIKTAPVPLGHETG